MAMDWVPFVNDIKLMLDGHLQVCKIKLYVPVCKSVPSLNL